MNAQVGEQVTLAVNIKGAKDKDPIAFEIKAGDDVLATVTGALNGGVATATWTVDLQGKLPPLEVTFTATLRGKVLSSDKLSIVPRTPVIGPIGPLGTAPLAAGVFVTAAGVLVVDIGAKLTLVTTISTERPADIAVFVDDLPQGDTSQPGKPLGAAIFEQHGVSGGFKPTLVTIDWQVAPVGTPLVRLRADVSIDGKRVDQRRSNLIVLADWVDVRLQDPGAVTDLGLGNEGRDHHVFLSGQPVPEVPDPDAPLPPPVAAQRVPAWSNSAVFVEIDGAVPEQAAAHPDELGSARVRFAHGAKAKQIALRAMQSQYGAAWRDAGATDPGAAVHRVIQPRTQLDLPLTARRRLSLWLAPNDWFGWPGKVDQPWEFNQHTQQIRDHVDDVVLLNLFTPVPAADPARTTIRYVGIPAEGAKGKTPAETAELAKQRVHNREMLPRIIKACHDAGTQVLLGHGGIINAVDDSPWLKFLLHTKGLTDEAIAAQARRIVELVIDVDGLAVDGFDFDLEHLTRSTVWPMELRRRVRTFYRALAVELHVRKKLLGIANSSYISHALVSDRTPATGSATGQTFTLAIECPNIIMRPMCYDNAFLGDKLLDFQRRVVAFALKDAPEGAGVHPAQFQVGVKTFKGTNNSEDGHDSTHLQGFYQNMPAPLLQICRDTLSPARVGVICFGPPFVHLKAIDDALNPLAGEKKQVATVGTPLQGPLE